MKKALFAVFALLALAACEQITEQVTDAVACPPIVGGSLTVSVQDSVTGANITPGATVVMRSGSSLDSAVGDPFANAVYVGGNRTGTFTVTVSQTGYQTWTKTGVKVEKGPCGAETVYLTARLKPSS